MAGLADRLRTETASLHRQAERCEVIVALFEGRLGRTTYTALLRNLHALYSALEAALSVPLLPAGLAPLIPPALRRADAIASDLDSLHGPGWRTVIPIGAATAAHVERIDWLSGSDPILLAAPAYVRYLGDLNGGRLIARSVSRAFELAPGGAGIRFYDFGGPVAAAALAATFRRVLDSIIEPERQVSTQGCGPALADRLVAEARWSFNAHLRLFEELRVSAGR